LIAQHKISKMKFQNNWRQKSLEVLENHNWGNPTNSPTNLVKRCIELSKVPVGTFTASDLRIMIGQKFGLTYLIPLAIEKLQEDLFLEAEMYEGDLIENILLIDKDFWDNNEDYWVKINDLIKHQRKQLIDKKIPTINFDNSKFVEK